MRRRAEDLNGQKNIVSYPLPLCRVMALTGKGLQTLLACFGCISPEQIFVC
jgi:hypothetical protein